MRNNGAPFGLQGLTREPETLKKGEQGPTSGEGKG